MIIKRPIAIVVYKKAGIDLIFHQISLDIVNSSEMKNYFLGMWRVKYKTQECNFS